MGESALLSRLHNTWLAVFLLLAGVAWVAEAAPRNVQFVWRYPAGEGVAGVAVYHAPSEAELLSGQNVTRVDLGLSPAAGDGVASVWLAGFDDSRDYYVALRVYDAFGNESGYSRTGVIRARPPADSVIQADDFESYRAGQDPDGWLDTASGSTQPGDATLFETRELPDGTIAFGTTSVAADLHSHLVDADSRHWASYEYSGRMLSDALVGEAGVTFLSGYPDQGFYYRLARNEAGPFTLSTRGGGELRCAGQRSSGVGARAGMWSRFQIRVTRFEGRNRIRANVWDDGTPAPPGWQIDCWDRNPQSIEAGRIGVYSSNGAGNAWDDLRVSGVSNDGAPPAWVPEAPPPAPASGYTSASRLVHWWNPGRDMTVLGRDFAWAASPIDVTGFKKGLNARDIMSPGTGSAWVSLNGGSEAFGTRDAQKLSIADTWSLGIWVSPDSLPKKKPSFVLDVNGTGAESGRNRISVAIGVDGRFAVEVSDAAGRTRGVAASTSISRSDLGKRWYHVVAVKSGSGSLALYVDGALVARADVAVPVQADAPRLLRVGTRVERGKGYGFAGGVQSIALWNTALRASEVQALFAGGNRARNLTAP